MEGTFVCMLRDWGDARALEEYFLCCVVPGSPGDWVVFGTADRHPHPFEYRVLAVWPGDVNLGGARAVCVRADQRTPPADLADLKLNVICSPARPGQDFEQWGPDPEERAHVIAEGRLLANGLAGQPLPARVPTVNGGPRPGDPPPPPPPPGMPGPAVGPIGGGEADGDAGPGEAVGPAPPPADLAAEVAAPRAVVSGMNVGAPSSPVPGVKKKKKKKKRAHSSSGSSSSSSSSSNRSAAGPGERYCQWLPRAPSASSSRRLC